LKFTLPDVNLPGSQITLAVLGYPLVYLLRTTSELFGFPIFTYERT